MVTAVILTRRAISKVPTTQVVEMQIQKKRDAATGILNSVKMIPSASGITCVTNVEIRDTRQRFARIIIVTIRRWKIHSTYTANDFQLTNIQIYRV